MKSATKWIAFSVGGSLALAVAAAHAADPSYKVLVWDEMFPKPPALEMAPGKEIEYKPLDKAAKKWDICVSFPHMKDAYWMAVDYGVTAESKRLGVKMNLVEAGGYPNLNKQLSQIEDCVAAGAQAVVIGAISFDATNNLVKEIRAKNIPVIDVINGMSAPELTAKSLVSFYDMGFKAAEYIAKLHPAGSGKVKVAWFPGPPGAGWVEAGNRGVLEAIKGSDIELVETKYGDTGKEVQLKLVEDTLEAHPDVKYILGTSPTAEAAMGLLRDRGLEDKIKVMSYYFTPPVYEGIKDGRIMAAPTDSPVVQGRVAIDQAVRALEGKDVVKRVSPAVFVIDKSNVGSFDHDSSLAPTDFKPTFSVD
jgi:protein TorT